MDSRGGVIDTLRLIYTRDSRLERANSGVYPHECAHLAHPPSGTREISKNPWGPSPLPAQRCECASRTVRDRHQPIALARVHELDAQQRVIRRSRQPARARADRSHASEREIVDVQVRVATPAAMRVARDALGGRIRERRPRPALQRAHAVAHVVGDVDLDDPRCRVEHATAELREERRAKPRRLLRTRIARCRPRGTTARVAAPPDAS
jgi:hypothetical protein